MELIDSLKQQIKEEIGDAELTNEQKKMLNQKYGVIPPQLTAPEKHIIVKESRTNGIN